MKITKNDSVLISQLSPSLRLEINMHLAGLKARASAKPIHPAKTIDELTLGCVFSSEEEIMNSKKK